MIRLRRSGNQNRIMIRGVISAYFPKLFVVNTHYSRFMVPAFRADGVSQLPGHRRLGIMPLNIWIISGWVRHIFPRNLLCLFPFSFPTNIPIRLSTTRDQEPRPMAVQAPRLFPLNSTLSQPPLTRLFHFTH